MKLSRLRCAATAMVVVTLSAPLAACGSSSSGASADGTTPVTIGIGVDASYAPFFLADQQGLFEKAGLDVTLQQFSAGGDAVDAIAGQQVQISAASPTTIVVKQAANPNLRSLFQFFTSDSDVSVVANSNITSASQIKTFGVMPGMSQYDAYEYLKDNGVDPSTVKFQQVQDPSTLPALTQKGDVDAYVLWEPWVTNGVKLGLHVLATTGSYGEPAQQYVVADKTWLDGHTEEAAKIAAVIKQATDEVQANPEEGAEATHAEAPAIATSDALATIKIIDFKTSPITKQDVTSVTDAGNYFVSLGMMKSVPDMGSALLTSWYSTNVQ